MQCSHFPFSVSTNFRKSCSSNATCGVLAAVLESPIIPRLNRHVNRSKLTAQSGPQLVLHLTVSPLLSTKELDTERVAILRLLPGCQGLLRCQVFSQALILILMLHYKQRAWRQWLPMCQDVNARGATLFASCSLALLQPTSKENVCWFIYQDLTYTETDMVNVE